MRYILLILTLLCVPLAGAAQRVSVHAVDAPAATVFRSIIEQTGLNFVYSSDVLRDVKISVDAKNRPVKNVLHDMFRGTDIEYSIKGKNVILRRKEAKTDDSNRPSAGVRVVEPLAEPPLVAENLLDELVVVSRLEAPAVETPEIGATKVTADQVRKTPALFGESDVIKALHTQPGVSEGTEGMAGMHVHGGGTDENLYMLDNVPLYQVNHFAGFFSAFNTDIIRYIDFFKTSFPAKYDGRLSSFMDVRLLNGGREKHHGTARIGLTSGAFNISGPIGDKTTYLVGLRRSWMDVLTIPLLAIANHDSEEKTRFHYYFMDANAKISHRFSDRASAFVSVYFGDDMVRTGSKDASDFSYTFIENDKYDLHWGNLVAQTGLNYRFNPALKAEFTAAYTRFFSDLRHDDKITYFYNSAITTTTHEKGRTDNNINDWIFRGDFDWQPGRDDMRVRFGGGYTRHSFLPARTTREFSYEDNKVSTRDSSWAYHANEVNAYIEDDWRVGDKLRVNAGLHTSLFEIDGKVKYGLSPRVSANWRLRDDISFKAAYSRTTQYVHQLAQSYLALPTDQWIPVTGNFKPQTADKVAIGAYWHTPDDGFAVSAEAYYKWMRNLVEYRDEYYLRPPFEMWNARLTSGRGTAKGIDLKLEKRNGRVTGHISYSLAWADRTFAFKNGGRTYPARFDNRHTINVVANWRISRKVTFNASWTGHSGNHFTLLPQVWESPSFGPHHFSGDYEPLQAPVNNYQLPFYHRLDLSVDVRNSRGYWTFGLYNAYNHKNTIAIRRNYSESVMLWPNGFVYTSKPVFQKVKLLPILPSISYTWQF